MKYLIWCMTQFNNRDSMEAKRYDIHVKLSICVKSDGTTAS